MALLTPSRVAFPCVKVSPVFKFLSKGGMIWTNSLDLRALDTARFILLVKGLAAGTTKLKKIHLPIIFWRQTNDTDCPDSICS